MLVVVSNVGTALVSFDDGQEAQAKALYPENKIIRVGNDFQVMTQVGTSFVPTTVPLDNAVVIVADPASENPPVQVAKVDLFRRADEDEAAMIMGALLTKDARMQAIFNSANTFRSDAEEWPMLVQAAHDLFGEERAAQLLAPSGV